MRRTRPSSAPRPRTAPCSRGRRRTVRVVFDDDVHEGPGNRGGAERRRLRPRRRPARRRRQDARLPLRRGLADGAYTVRWSIISDDGHLESRRPRVRGRHRPARRRWRSSTPAAGRSRASVVSRWLFLAGVLAAVGIALFALRRGVRRGAGGADACASARSSRRSARRTRHTASGSRRAPERRSSPAPRSPCSSRSSRARRRSSDARFGRRCCSRCGSSSCRRSPATRSTAALSRGQRRRRHPARRRRVGVGRRAARTRAVRARGVAGVLLAAWRRPARRSPASCVRPTSCCMSRSCGRRRTARALLVKTALLLAALAAGGSCARACGRASSSSRSCVLIVAVAVLVSAAGSQRGGAAVTRAAVPQEPQPAPPPPPPDAVIARAGGGAARRRARGRSRSSLTAIVLSPAGGGMRRAAGADRRPCGGRVRQRLLPRADRARRHGRCRSRFGAYRASVVRRAGTRADATATHPRASSARYRALQSVDYVERLRVRPDARRLGALAPRGADRVGTRSPAAAQAIVIGDAPLGPRDAERRWVESPQTPLPQPRRSGRFATNAHVIASTARRRRSRSPIRRFRAFFTVTLDPADAAAARPAHDGGRALHDRQLRQASTRRGRSPPR